MEQIQSLLTGNYKAVANELKQQMLTASEELAFERAAELRDRLNAIEALGQKQLVTAGRMADTDAVGYFQTEAKGCFVVLHYVSGNLIDKDYEIVPPSDTSEEAVSTLVKQYYLARGAAPRQILLPMEMEDAAPFEQLLEQNLGKKVRLRVPQRGDNTRLVELALRNAREEAERVTTKEEKLRGTVTVLQQMLGLDGPLHRMESYDISNISGTDIVASMVVFVDGRPARGSHKRFQLEGLEDQDDYASMRQVLRRRFTHYLAGDKGFDAMPDLLLIDGGVNHAKTVREELSAMGIQTPIFGMVKDDRHRTRALVTPDGEEISIAAKQSAFALIGTIQEETHRFAITYHRKLRSKRVQSSGLEKIPGIGPKRRADLLKRFKTVKAVREASLQELEAILPKDAANAVYSYFRQEENT